MPILAGLPSEFSSHLDRVLANEQPRLEAMEAGTITSVSRGIVHISGFTSVRTNEIIRMPDGLAGQAISINTHEIGVLLLGDGRHLRPGDLACRTHRSNSVPVGDELLGRVVDPLGRPLDAGGRIQEKAERLIQSTAPAILHRASVSEPLQTGIKAIDAAIPIGKGQRELILGDRQIGKTAIAVAAMINQRDTGVIGIYCAIGQRAVTTARVIRTLEQAGMRRKTIVVSTTGEDAPGLQYIAPYAAMSMAEYFMHRGRDVLIVFDDLTRHARSYRELSLLLRRPPGREAYPGDIFHIHAQLLERATHLQANRGGGSITALPIVETQAGNIAAYIPTNLISITDGQIYLTPKLFQMGVLPAIDIGQSVSRVGGKAQLPVFRSVVQALKLAYTQFEELESFAKFGTRLDEQAQQSITRGRRVREILKQDERDLFSVPEQIVVLLAVTSGLMDDIPVEDVHDAELTVRRAVRGDRHMLDELMGSREKLDEQSRQPILSLARRALRSGGYAVRG